MIAQVDLWANHEKRVLEVLVEALTILRNIVMGRGNTMSELELNRELYFCFHEANKFIRSQNPNGGFLYPPTPEGQNPPDPDDIFRTKRERKIPDFYWAYYDDTLEPRKSAKCFYIECKRLGKPERSDWIFNKNYCIYGINRFISETHGYAKGEKSAAMVGYVQGMELSEILSEVNSAASNFLIAPLTLSNDGWKKGNTSRLSHSLIRSFIRIISNFLSNN